MLDKTTIIKTLVPIFRPILSLGSSDFILRAAFLPNCESTPPYATIHVTNYTAVGTGEQGRVYETGQQVAQDYYVSVDIRTYGPQANMRLDALVLQLKTFASIQDIMSYAGVGFSSNSTVLDMTKLVRTNYEERAGTKLILTMCDGDFTETLPGDVEDLGKPGQPVFDAATVPVNKVPVSGNLINPDSENTQEYTVDRSITQPPHI